MKKLWTENRVLFALFIILIVCFIAIVSVTISYFVGSKKSVYGDRLENEVEITKAKQSKYVDHLKSIEGVKSVDFTTSTRTIYVDITFDSNLTLVEAESKAAESVDQLDKKILKYYDINFIIRKNASDKEDGFLVMGARNSSGTGVIWNNNTVEAEEE